MPAIGADIIAYRGHGPLLHSDAERGNERSPDFIVFHPG